jgi:NAD-dependent dihydropyrimidine dehydrogenase PreA subunit
MTSLRKRKTRMFLGIAVAATIAVPVDVIRMDAATAKPVVAYPRDCQVCYLCEDDCPTHSISLSHDISNSRRYSTYDQFGLKI